MIPTEPPTDRLVLAEVGKVYPTAAVTALSGISFTVESGEVLALMGPSGCGKSTLLNLLGTLDRPTEGRIELNGHPLLEHRPLHRFRATALGFVFQFHHLVSGMTLLENVEAPLRAVGTPARARRAAAREALERCGLGARADFLPARVSGGERQRAAVARALVNRPRLILADEPTGNLDSKNGQAIAELLVQSARERGAIVVLATHNAEVASLADRVAFLRDGRLESLQAAPKAPVARAG